MRASGSGEEEQARASGGEEKDQRSRAIGQRRLGGRPANEAERLGRPAHIVWI
jgi:hypothetical protein